MVIYFQVKKSITQNIQSELHNSTTSVLNMVRTAANVSVKNYLRAVCEKNLQNIEAIYKRYEFGSITEDEAKEEARRILFSQVIGKTGYIYCVNSLGVAIEHQNPDVAGKSDWAEMPFVRQMIRMKHGYMEYDWKNPGEEQYRPKAIYMDYFAPWDWIISVSTYTEELKDLINVNDFRASVLAMKFGKTGYSFIIDDKGNPIVHPMLEGNSMADIQTLDRDDIIQEIIQKKTGKLIYYWKNSETEPYRKKLVIFNHIPEYDWIVASSGYFDEFYSILETVGRIIIISIVFMLGLAFLTSLWLTRLIIEPLNRLMAYLDMGIPETLSTRMPITSIDEIGKLVSYFNGFMEKLEAYSHSLKNETAEHRLTAEALMESEWRYRIILKCIHEGYFEADLKGGIQFVNHSMGVITGYSRQELLKKNIVHLISSRDTENIFRIFNGTGFKDEGAGVYEWELVRKDGSSCFVETSLSVMADKFNHQTGIRGVVRDVTSRIQARKALQLSEELFSKAFQCSPNGMFVAHIENGRLIHVNDSFLSITGYDAATVLGKELMNIGFFRNRKEGKRIFKIIHEKQSLRNREIEFYRASGEIREGTLSAEVLEIRGEICILAALEDCTESRKLERQFLDMTEQQRREIAFALHDDLGPQLIGIEMLIEILKQNLSNPLPEKMDRMEKIETLIQDSIRKTRLLSRGLAPVDIAERGFDASLSGLAAHVQDMYGIVCTRDCDGSTPFAGNTEATHAYYIAHEAVHNAVKHAGARHIGIHFSTHKNKTILMVRDDGKGIDTKQNPACLGLKIMGYRAKRLNATLDIRKGARGGTIVLMEMEGPGTETIEEEDR
jgi:PAS domain S-box-containing protein